MQATATSEELKRFHLQVGDVLITKDSEEWNDIGVPSVVEYTASDLVCGYHLALLRPCFGIITGNYLLRVLQSLGVAYQFHVSANGVTRYGLSHDAIKKVLLPIPPLPEQIIIVNFLNEATKSLDETIDRTQHEIGLLLEYRVRLIANVVTGRLDVREAAAELPEEKELHPEIIDLIRDGVDNDNGDSYSDSDGNSNDDLEEHDDVDEEVEG
jgi:type I restriction enzyme S subunit